MKQIRICNDLKYKQYFLSNYYKEIEKELLKLQDKKCYLCNHEVNLIGYHLDKKTMYKEIPLKSIILLCKYCFDELKHEERICNSQEGRIHKIEKEIRGLNKQLKKLGRTKRSLEKCLKRPLKKVKLKDSLNKIVLDFDIKID